MSDTSSSAQQPLLSQGLLQKLLPAVPVPCNIPPISLPQLPGIFKSFHRLSYFWQSGHCFFGFRNSIFSRAGCQPYVQPPAILEDRLDCFLVRVFVTDQSGMGGPTSSYATASIAPWLIRPHKPHHHHHQGLAIPRWGCQIHPHRNAVFIPANFYSSEICWT